MDRCKKAEKGYEDYKKFQEARIHDHPGHDPWQVGVGKLQALRETSHQENEHLTRILADLGSLPSHRLSDVVGYNEHNHLADKALAEERRRAAIAEVEARLKERHDHVDRSIIALKARLEGLINERQAREAHRDTSPPVDPDEMVVEEAIGLRDANVQRVVAVEVRSESVSLDQFY